MPMVGKRWVLDAGTTSWTMEPTIAPWVTRGMNNPPTAPPPTLSQVDRARMANRAISRPRVRSDVAAQSIA